MRSRVIDTALPCPFCQCTKVLLTLTCCTERLVLACSECGACGPATLMVSHAHEAISEAIALWNDRK